MLVRMAVAQTADTVLFKTGKSHRSTRIVSVPQARRSIREPDRLHRHIAAMKKLAGRKPKETDRLAASRVIPGLPTDTSTASARIDVRHRSELDRVPTLKDALEKNSPGGEDHKPAPGSSRRG